MRFGILRQWWHLPVVGGLILDAVRDLYGQLLFRHNEVYLLLRIQEKHILCCGIGQNLVILPAKMQKTILSTAQRCGVYWHVTRAMIYEDGPGADYRTGSMVPGFIRL